MRTHEFLPSDMYYSEEFENAFDQKDYELVAIGNSKLLSSLDKATLQTEFGLKSVILGYASANISISRLTLESYLDKCIKKPRIVLLEVSWFTFSTKRLNFGSLSGDLLLKDIKLWTKIPRYQPFFIRSLKISIKNQLQAKIFPVKNITYSSMFKEKSPNTVDYSFSVVDFEKRFPNHQAGIEKLLLEDYYSIVKLCLKENIKLILYTAPEDKFYTSLQSDKESVKNIFLKTSTAEYLDFTFSSVLWTKEYELWLRDSHHINENDLFTHILVDEIKKRNHNKIYVP